MIVAATHLSPWVTLVLASALLFTMAWYWGRLAGADVHPLRRRIRRASLVFGLLAVVAAALGFGIIDPDATPLPYLFAWLAAALALLGVVLLAMFDAFASIRMHRRELAITRRESADALRRATDNVIADSVKDKL